MGGSMVNFVSQALLLIVKVSDSRRFPADRPQSPADRTQVPVPTPGLLTTAPEP